ncbi:MAG TPA: hypothetical protein VMU73_06575 [Gaiellaceae bacterium]|nr:hypothetical protein [Gaiellaceae bacterium]
MKKSPIRIAATVLVVVAALSGVAFGAPGRGSSPAASALDSFGGTTPVAANVVYTAPPLYREPTVRTSFKLHRVTCATAAQGDPSACYAAR